MSLFVATRQKSCEGFCSCWLAAGFSILKRRGVASLALTVCDARLATEPAPHRPRSSPVSPSTHRKPGRASSIVKSPGSGGSASGGRSPEESGSDSAGRRGADDVRSGFPAPGNTSLSALAAPASNNNTLLAANAKADCGDSAVGSRSFAARKSLKNERALPRLKITECHEALSGVEPECGVCRPQPRRGSNAWLIACQTTTFFTVSHPLFCTFACRLPKHAMDLSGPFATTLNLYEKMRVLVHVLQFTSASLHS